MSERWYRVDNMDDSPLGRTPIVEVESKLLGTISMHYSNTRILEFPTTQEANHVQFRDKDNDVHRLPSGDIDEADLIRLDVLDFPKERMPIVPTEIIEWAFTRSLLEEGHAVMEQAPQYTAAPPSNEYPRSISDTVVSYLFETAQALAQAKVQDLLKRL